MYKQFFALSTILLFAGAGCSQTTQLNVSDSSESTMTPPSTNQEQTMTTNEQGLVMTRTETNSDSKNGPIAVMKTTKGDIKIQLFEEATPNTVKNFVDLASSDFYTGTIFHRVIPDFMIQGGDPLTKEQRENVAVHGTGGPGYRFGDEINLHSNVRGTLSMANAGPNTNGSQFFINVADNTFLDGRHAVFGEVIEGLDIADQIVNAETGPNDHPVNDIEILAIEIQA